MSSDAAGVPGDDVGVPSDDAGVPNDTIPKQLASVLAPIDRHAFGVAIGSACGLGIFLLTARVG